MKLYELVILPLLLLHEAACTHLETCDCHEIQGLVNKSVEQQVHEIKAIVNATVEEAVARLEYKLSHKIHTATSRINTTNGIELSDLENNLKSTMERLLKPIQRQLDYHLPLLPINISEDNPAESCKAIYDKFPYASSGYYWIKTSGSPIRVYCKMNSTCEHLKGGWMRVANIDMRNSSHQCPSGFSSTTRSSNPRRVCDITHNGCVGARFTVHGKRYSHVYGRIIAYQNGYPIAFYRYDSWRQVDQQYVYGVSLTHGQNPRKHIWTFVGASDETASDIAYKCPCINTNIHSSIRIPSFIGNDYFCDTSLSNLFVTYSKAFYPSDPLWDGQGCGPTNTCCSVPSECNNSPPWFIKNLPSPTTDDVEMRLCRPRSDGSTPIEIVELYVQ